MVRRRGSAINLLLVAFGLIACNETTMSPTGGFERAYLVARNALETGQYDLAERSYAALVDTAGPLEQRMRIEYSHSLLRADKFAQASVEATRVAGSTDPKARASALAIRASADHELARSEIETGKANASTYSRLASASRDLGEVLSRHKDLDPIGVMSARNAALSAEIGALRQAGLM